MSTPELLATAPAKREGLQALSERVDPDARDVVARLIAGGHEAYLVGGCVRDLLLDRTPKDFDVATSAHPSEIRMLFKNCRLIGRRFRLAHIYFRGGKIIETATFRANPYEGLEEPPEDLLINQDNVFGNAEQDARRRDFTVNGLFFEPEQAVVIDYVGGLADLDQGVVRTIGDPDVRIQEDPVRILRAVKFAARLGFALGERTRAAMRTHASAIERCAPARVIEEIYRLVHCGAARRAFGLMIDTGVFSALLPEIRVAQNDHPDAVRLLLDHLGAYDDARARGYEGTNALAFALLTFGAYLEQGDDRATWLDALHEQAGERLRVPKRDRERARMLQQLCYELSQRPALERTARVLVRRLAFAEALVLYALTLRASGQPLFEVGAWKARAAQLGVELRSLPGAVELKRKPATRRGGRRRASGRGRSSPRRRGRGGAQA